MVIAVSEFCHIVTFQTCKAGHSPFCYGYISASVKNELVNSTGGVYNYQLGRK